MRFCTACGGPVIGHAPAPVSQPAAEKLSTHLRVMGVLWVVYSILRVFMGAMTLAVSHYFLPMMSSFMPRDVSPVPIVAMLHGVYAFTFVYSVAAGIAGIVAASGLLQRKPWGRVMALVMAFISVINIPFGTAIGVYTLVVLLSSNAGENYRRIAVPA
jgi:hypothetical protein